MCYWSTYNGYFRDYSSTHNMYIVVIGAILGGFGLYDPLVKFAGAGAFIPISSFGNTLVTAAIKEATETGFIGIFTGMLKTVSGGVSAAIIFGFLAAMIFKPKG